MTKREAKAKGEPASEPEAAEATTVERADLGAAHERFGWALLATGVVLGTAVEALLGFKSASFMLDPLRRELWSLAHFHAAFLGLVNVAYARGAVGSVGLSRALRAGSVLLPLGFALGGLAHPEGDPGIGIMLAPVGALLVAAALVARAVSAPARRP